MIAAEGRELSVHHPQGPSQKPLHQLGENWGSPGQEKSLPPALRSTAGFIPARLTLPTSRARLLCREGSPSPPEPAPSRRSCFPSWSLAGSWEAGPGTAPPSLTDKGGSLRPPHKPRDLCGTPAFLLRAWALGWWLCGQRPVKTLRTQPVLGVPGQTHRPRAVSAGEGARSAPPRRRKGASDPKPAHGPPQTLTVALTEAVESFCCHRPRQRGCGSATCRVPRARLVNHGTCEWSRGPPTQLCTEKCLSLSSY